MKGKAQHQNKLISVISTKTPTKPHQSPYLQNKENIIETKTVNLFNRTTK